MSGIGVNKFGGLFSMFAAMFGWAANAEASNPGHGQSRAPVSSSQDNPGIHIPDPCPAAQAKTAAEARPHIAPDSAHAADINFKPEINKHIAHFTGTINTVGSTLTRIDEDGQASVFSFDPVHNNYVYHCDDGTVQNLVANRHGEWVWRDDRKDPRRAYEIYNPIKTGGRKAAVEASAHTAEHPSVEGACRLSSVIATNGEATNFHYCANGKLVGMVTVNGHQTPFGF
jgi:hypothetical protein